MRERFALLSPSTRLSLGLCAMFLVQFFVFLVSGGDPVGRFFGLRVNPLDWSVPYRLFTYALVHSLEDPKHIVLNALTLYFVGNLLEAGRGPKTTLLTFWIGVAVGGIFFGAWEIARGAGLSPLYGASAGVYAVLVSAAISFPNVTLLTIPLWIFTIIFVALDLLQFAFSARLGGDTVVAYIAHIGGASAGLFLGWRGVHDSPFPRPGLWARWKEARRAARERAEDERAREKAQKLDRILEKIHELGLAALTEEESRFLKAGSKKNSPAEG
ncbi:MAG: rhomboid family intramembrane serine protease [Planctomycetes bacterium]|nr:rhomboid family intramembrane serine protease [Planctomycetota bacterium]